MKKLYKFCCSAIFIVVGLPIIGYTVIRLIMDICNLFKQSKDLYSFVPVLLCILYLIFAFLLIRALLKSAKYFSKLDVLEKLMALDSKNNQNTNTDGSNQDKQNNQNANINDKELIKKYCDTLVDL